MKKTQEQLFLEVKERLDYYRLPTVFPFEALDLLSQLLGLVDKHSHKNGKENQQMNKGQTSNQLNDALRHEIGKVIKQNNRLHMELISAKQQIMSLKHSNDKLLIQRSGGSKQMTVLLQNQRKRQDQLFQQLTQVKFKYNELMDLVHEDSQVQKKYIKRLMKHRKMEISQPKQTSGSQFKKGQHQTVTELQAKLILLQHKLANRESQIMRLQKRSEYDGLNMNKILKNFQNQRTDNKVSSLEQQIEYLEAQNKKMKQQVDSCRKKGGSKQALREQMRKNHETIGRLEKENKQLKKKMKQKQFDGKAKQKNDMRENSKIKQQSELNKSELQLAQIKIKDLQKKVQYLNRELDISKAAIRKQQKQNEEKDLIIERIKNSEEGDKILAQYQVQSLKQKVQQLESDLELQIERSSQLKAENDYHKQEDRLKNEAIQNLEKIVDELMKRNTQQNADQGHAEYSSSNLENTIALRKNLAQMKQHLALSQNQRQKIERQLQTIVARFDQKSQESHLLNEELNRMKIKVLEMKNNEEQFFVLQRQVSTLQSDLKKEQNFRYRIDQLHQQAQNDKSRLRKELQELTQQFEIYERKSKNHMNTLKMQNNELEQSNQMLELMVKQKDKKIIMMQGHIEELSGKIKIIKEQINVIEDQKLNAIRQKHKYEKRCEDMMRVTNESNILNQQTRDLESNSLHNQILEYQKEVKKLHEKVLVQNEQINQLNSYCDTMKLSQQNLVQERNFLKRENERLRNLEGSGSGEEEQ